MAILNAECTMQPLENNERVAFSAGYSENHMLINVASGSSYQNNPDLCREEYSGRCSPQRPTGGGIS